MSRFVRAKFSRAVREQRREHDALQAATYGLSLAEYADAVGCHLRDLYREAEVGVRVQLEAFAKIVASGKVAPVSRETFDPRRIDHKARPLLEKLVYVGPRPAYGYLFTEAEGYGPARDGKGNLVRALAPFGPLRLVLHPRVRGDCTVTLGDSIPTTVLYGDDDADGLRGIAAAEVRPAELLYPDLLSAFPELDPLAWRTVGPLDEFGLAHGYAEVQLHRPLSLADIARVDIVDEGVDEAQVERIAAGAGLEIGRARGEARGSVLPSWMLLEYAIFDREGYGNGVPAFESPVHGDEHWRRVADVGLRLADETAGADHRIVYLFALLHDSQRWTDEDDPEHGLRAAGVAQMFADAGHLEPLTASEVDTLLLALSLHDAGYISDDPTVGVCWDADRLDLPRVGITPDPALLSTDAGRRRIGRPRPVIVPPWASLYLNCAQARFSSPSNPPHSLKARHTGRRRGPDSHICGYRQSYV